MTEENEFSVLGAYTSISPCVVGVVTEDAHGKAGVGTATHIGDGVLLTARHVVEGRQITDFVASRCDVAASSATVLYPADPTIDLALIKSDFSLATYVNSTRFQIGEQQLKPPMDHVRIGDHLDDWLGHELILEHILVFGYPPIPLSSRPELVAARGEVNAIIDPYAGARHPHFIVSPAPRGGFSGGPVLLASNAVLLGVVVSSLSHDEMQLETGFHAAVSVEPVWNLLFEHDIFPGTNSHTMYLFASPDERKHMPISDDLKMRLEEYEKSGFKSDPIS